MCGSAEKGEKDGQYRFLRLFKLAQDESAVDDEMISLRKGKKEWTAQLDEFLLCDKEEKPKNSLPSPVKEEQTPLSQMESPKYLKKSHTLRLNCKLKNI